MAGQPNIGLVEISSASSEGEGLEGVPGVGHADCVTVKVCLAIVIVPVRWLAPVFIATVNVTVPLPFPPLPEPIVIQEVFVVAVQLQPFGALTFTVQVPPNASHC